MQYSPQTAHNAYQIGQIGSAGPLRIIVLLYEGALRFSHQALQRFDDPAARGLALGRAHRIVSELMAALDHEKGHDIAANLDSLYRYMLDALTRVNVSNDSKALESVIRLIETLLPAWREIEVRMQNGEVK